jgi:hypothetical protein
VKAAILAELLRFTVYAHDVDEPREARIARLEPLAQAIDIVADGKPWRAAMLITQAEFESKLARYVGEGRCQDGPKGARCDTDARGIERARGYFQVHAWCAEAWAQPVGSVEELTAAAACTLKLFGAGYARCKGKPDPPEAGAFAASMGGVACTGPRALARTKFFRGVLYRLQAKTKAQPSS